jgi:plasmid stabilization system protein ParE
MAEVIWTEPALSALDAIADYIVLDNPDAARQFVQNVFRHVEPLAEHPKLGSKPQKLKGWSYRHLVEGPCRIFYRQDDDRVYILYVMRAERMLRSGVLSSRNRKAPK